MLTHVVLIRSRSIFQRNKLGAVLALLATIIFSGIAERGSAGSATPLSAPPAATPTPVVTIDLPNEVLINQDFDFQVKFKNNGGGVGFAPYIELYLPSKGVDGNALGIKCDGIRFKSAVELFTNPATVPLLPVYDSQLDTTPGNVDCPKAYSLPFAGMTPVAAAPSGDYQLVVLELPFGSVYTAQPEFEITVSAHLSDYADAGVPLTVYARGGFKFGADPANNHPLDPLLESAVVSDHTTPVVFKLSKNVLTPEGETATGPNFPHRYDIGVDIADQQKIDNLIVHDFLANNVQYQDAVKVTIGGAIAVGGTSCTTPGIDYVLTKEPPLTSAQNSPTNELEVTFCHQMIGSQATVDVGISFSFFIPEVDANSNSVLPQNCQPVTSVNDIKADYDWTPADPRDLPAQHLTSDETPQDHTLLDKCVAAQKQVGISTDTNAPGLTPGDVLKYQIDIQFSDYKTFGKLSAVDLLGDGQQLITTGPLTPTLSVSDKFGTVTGTFILNSDLFFVLDKKQSCNVSQGVTQITFDISQKMINLAPPNPRHAAGIVTGGYATTTSPFGAATATIVFYAKVMDQFNFSHVGDAFVDKDDLLPNCLDVSGEVFTNVNPKPLPTGTGVTAHDDSQTTIILPPGIVNKKIWAIERGATFVCKPSGPACPVDVHPGDKVTFKIEYPIPSGDVENLKFEDFFPAPIFDANDPAATGSSAWLSAVPFCSGAAPFTPLPGRACRLAAGQSVPWHSLAGAPTLVPGTANNIAFSYLPSISNPLNTLKYVELLETITATNVPFADGLYLQNEVYETESNSFGLTFPETTIMPVHVREPKVAIRKGVIATDDLNGVFSDPASPQTTPDHTAQAPANAMLSLSGINGVVTSADLSAGLLNSNISNVDANDVITFSIVIENQGGHPAFDVQLQDTIPACFTNVSGLTVKWGTGKGVKTPTYTLTTTGTGFTFSLNPGFSLPAASTTGSNIIVITFNAKLVSNIGPGCCDNVAELKNYASEHNGPNFVTAGFGGTFTPPSTSPFQDSASACVTPKADKCITRTSEQHTQPDNSLGGTPDVAIGEIVRFQLRLTLPEGVTSFVNFKDYLPAGMTYMNDGTAKVAFVSNGGITTNVAALSGLTGLNINSTNLNTTCGVSVAAAPMPSSLISGGATSGAPVSFVLGSLTNNDNDGDLEYVFVEFNAIVNNMSTNVNNTLLDNYYDVFSSKKPGTGPPIATSNHETVRVVEPKLTMTKTVSPNPVQTGQTLTYTVQFTNSSSADAFDVVLKDTLPSGLTLGTITSSCPFTAVGNTLTMTCAQVPKAPAPGSTVMISYQATANPPNCPAAFNNSASLIWTSLPINGTPLGPNNLTGSITPGTTGTIKGERDGITPPLSLNSYATAASIIANIDCGCCANPPQGMVSWWNLNELLGATTVVDIADGNNGTPRNSSGAAISIGTGGDPASLVGQHVGNSLNFVTSFVDVPNAANLNFGNGEFSIDAWARVIPNGVGTQNPTVQAIVDKIQSTSGTPSVRGYALFVNHAAGSTTGRLGFVIDDGTFAPTPLFHPAALSAGWHHFAVTVARTSTTSTNITLFVDGVASLPVSKTVGSTTNTANFWIGRSRLLSFLQAGFREVSLDEIEIFNRAISAADIQSIFNAGTTGKCTGKITGVKFNDLNGNGIRDTGEPALANWTITIKDQSNNLHSTTTDSAGNYFFTVPAGSYTVSEVLQTGWTQTAPANGTVNTTVAANQTATIDFGNQQKGNCDLMVRKEMKPTPLIAGQPASAVITVTNIGSAPCSGPTQISESLPAGLSLVSASGTGWTCNGTNCSYSSILNPGASATLTFNFMVADQPPTSIQNCAKLENASDSNAANNQACAESSVSETKLPDLAIDKKVSCVQGPVGPVCTVTFNIVNNGPGAFNGFLMVQDVISPTPGYLSLASGNPPGWNCSISSGNTISCTSTSTINLGSTTLTVPVRIAQGQYQNCVEVSGYSQQPLVTANLVTETVTSNNKQCVSFGTMNAAAITDEGFGLYVILAHVLRIFSPS